MKQEEPATDAEREESVQALEELKGRVPLMSQDDVQSAIDRLIQRVRSSGSICGGLSRCIHAEGRCPVGHHPPDSERVQGAQQEVVHFVCKPQHTVHPHVARLLMISLSVSKQVGGNGAARSLQGGGDQAPASNSSGDSSSSDSAASDASSGGSSSEQVGAAVAA